MLQRNVKFTPFVQMKEEGAGFRNIRLRHYLNREIFMVDVVHDPAPRLIDHPGLRALYDYWDGCRQGGRLPGRQHIDPLHIPDLLPNLMLFDVAAPDDLRYRLVGTALVARLGRDPTGLPAQDGYLGEDWEKIRPDYLYVVAERRPCLRWNAVLGPRAKRLPYQRLLLPLARDGATVDMLLAGVYWLD
jgi:hypothetical protein